MLYFPSLFLLHGYILAQAMVAGRRKKCNLHPGDLVVSTVCAVLGNSGKLLSPVVKSKEKLETKDQTLDHDDLIGIQPRIASTE